MQELQEFIGDNLSMYCLCRFADEASSANCGRTDVD